MDFFKIEYVIPLAGVLSFIIGLIKYRTYKRLTKSGTQTEGIIVDLIEERDDGTSHFWPVVKFKNVNQFWVTIKADISVNSYSKYKKGDLVSILFDENNPEKFIINDGQYINGIYVFIIIGLIFLVYGLLVLFFKTE